LKLAAYFCRFFCRFLCRLPVANSRYCASNRYQAVAKTNSPQQIIGKRGLHPLADRILGVTLTVHPTGSSDAGIDGFIALRDPESGEVRTQFIPGRLKTTDKQPLADETGESVSYICKQEDLDYWMQSDAPVAAASGAGGAGSESPRWIPRPRRVQRRRLPPPLPLFSSAGR
jgi:hypothetical protein